MSKDHIAVVVDDIINGKTKFQDSYICDIIQHESFNKLLELDYNYYTTIKAILDVNYDDFIQHIKLLTNAQINDILFDKNFHDYIDFFYKQENFEIYFEIDKTKFKNTIENTDEIIIPLFLIKILHLNNYDFTATSTRLNMYSCHIRDLIELKILDVNYIDENGNTLLFYMSTIFIDYIDLLFLFENGLNIHHINNLGQSIAWHIQEDMLAVWEYLNENNFNFHHRDNNGKTMFYYKIPENILELNIEIYDDIREIILSDTLDLKGGVSDQVIKYLLTKLDLIDIKIYQKLLPFLITKENIKLTFSKILYVTPEYLTFWQYKYNDILLLYVIKNYYTDVDNTVLYNIRELKNIEKLVTKYNLTFDSTDLDYLYKFLDFMLMNNTCRILLLYLIKNNIYNHELIQEYFTSKGYKLVNFCTTTNKPTGLGFGKIDQIGKSYIFDEKYL